MCGYPSLCNPMNWIPPDSSTHGIFQGRIQKWHPISYSRYLPNPGIDWNLFSCISCIGRQILYHWHHLESLCICMYVCGEDNGTPFQYSCLRNPIDREAWWVTVHGITRSRTWLKDFTFSFHFHVLEKGMSTHSSILVWRIPGMEEPGGQPSMGLHRVRHCWCDLAAAAAAAACMYVCMFVHTYLNNFAAHMKLMHYCKSTIVQFF